jgi:hypothetical protein
VKAGAATAWVSSGLAALTGRADGPALRPKHHTVELVRSWFADCAAHAADWPELDAAILLTERAALTGRGRAGTVSVGGSAQMLACADGWLAFSRARPDDDLLIAALISQRIAGSPWPALARWCAHRPGASIVAQAAELSLPVGLVGECADSMLEQTPASGIVGLAGLRVVDFSALWAGPLCASLLSRAGAEVIRVETAARPDGARRGEPRFHDLLRAGHRSVVIDPDRDRAELQALVAGADVVIEASRPRALRRWGLDAHAEVARGAIWLSITAYGRDVDRVGFGDDVAAAAGLVAFEAADGPPLFCGDAIADPLTGVFAAREVVLSLAAGTGVLLDIAMAEVAASTVRDWHVVARPVLEPVPVPQRRRPAEDTAEAFGAATTEILG